MRIPIELLPACNGACSPAEYIRLARSDEWNIRPERIQPPQLGRPSFGALMGEHRPPVFRRRDAGE
ncbi:MAG TPA: hypothetical protein VGO40_18675 [Longimicrobium sp.]|jgi:hypothetical protein|nr:hypothetical protein [Longimicrobium sp.]